MAAAKPGDTVFVVPSMTYGPLPLMASGTASAPITLVGSDPAHPTKVTGQGINAGIWVDGNYVVVKNFDVTAPGSYAAISVAPNHHHVTIAGNRIHDAGGDGITTYSDDYLTITNNAVFGNARNTTQAFGSGISIYASVDIDANTGVKMLVQGNIVYRNTNTPNCATSACYATALDSDGSGIILDNNRRQGIDQRRYKGAFLVQNNVIFRNGGRGVHVYNTDNATVTSNTMWENNQDPYEGFWHPGEVSGVYAGKLSVYNNILYSDGGTGPNHTGTAPNTHVVMSFEDCTDGVGPITAEHNIGYNPKGDASLSLYVQSNTNPVVSTPNLFADPMLENPAGGYFRFRPGSPAQGTADAALSPATDRVGASRAPSPSIGAYQQAGP